MTPEQKRELIAACEAGDDVRAVTLGLQIAAWNARAGFQETAITCRRLVDDLRHADTNRAEYMQRRLAIATAVSPVLIGHGLREDAAAEAIRYADALLEALSSIGIGE
jgi:hypothetical protein